MRKACAPVTKELARLTYLAINAAVTRDLFSISGKNNRFPFLDILGYLKNTHKSPKFGRVRQVPTSELGREFLGWDLSHFAKFGIFYGCSLNTLKYPKMGICYFFPVNTTERRFYQLNM